MVAAQEPKKMNLVMELVTGGELFDRIVVRICALQRRSNAMG